MAHILDKLMFESIDMIRTYDPTDNTLLTIYDQPKSYSIENTADLTDVTGKNGIILSTLERNKQTNLTFSNGYVMISSLAAQLGSEVEVATGDTLDAIAVPWYETQKVAAGTDSATIITLEFAPVVNALAGQEVIVYKMNKDGTQGDRIETTNITVSEKVVTISSGVTVGDEVIVTYDRNALDSVQKIGNNTENSSKYVRVVADIIAADVCDQNIKYHVLFDMPQGKLDSNTTLEFNEDGTFPEVSIRAIKSPCSTDGNLWSMYVVDDNVE